MTARPFGDIAASYVGKRKLRGDPTNPTDPVHRNSIHEDDIRAQPWNGRRKPSKAEWDAEKAWWLAAFDAQRREDQLALQKARNAERQARLESRDLALEESVAAQADGLTANDREVLLFLLEHPATRHGKCFPSQATIARGIGRCEEFVNASAARLDRKGLFRKIRRSKDRKCAAGDPGPRLVQTSCVYDFDWRRLRGRAREVFLRMRTCAIKKLGRVQSALRAVANNDHLARLPSAAKTIALIADDALRETMERIEREHFPPSAAV